jgi:O-antigen/teichoic acid export membrane protein
MSGAKQFSTLPSNRQLATYAVGYVAGTATQKGLGFGLFLILANVLTIEEYALFGLMYALQAGIASFAMAGTIETVISELKHRQSASSQLELFRQTNFLFFIVAFAVFVIGSITFLILSAMPPSAIFIAILLGSVGAFLTVQAQFARLTERHKRALLLGNAPQLLGLACASAAAYFAANSVLIMATMLIGYATAFIVLAITGKTVEVRLDASKSNIPKVLSYRPFFIVSIFDWLAGYGSFFLFQSLFGNIEIAQFTLAYTLSSVLHLVGTSLNQVWSPKLYRNLSAEEPDFYRHNTIFYLLQGLIIGVIGGIILIITPLAPIFLNSNAEIYADLVPKMYFLFLSYAMIVPWYYSQNFFYFFGESNTLWKLSVGAGIVGLALWYGLALSIGPLGGYAGFLVTVVVKTSVGTIIARRKWAARVQWEGALICVALVSSGAAVATMLQDSTPFAVSTRP